WFRSVDASSRPYSTPAHDVVRDRGAAGLPVEIDPPGLWKDRLAVSASAEVGQRGEQELPAATKPAPLRSHSGRSEKAEAAIVRVMCGEAGDLAFVLQIEDGCAKRRFESPHWPEVTFDEVEHVLPPIASRWGAGGLA